MVCFSGEKESEEVFGREQARHQQRSEREMLGMRRGIAGKARQHDRETRIPGQPGK